MLQILMLLVRKLISSVKATVTWSRDSFGSLLKTGPPSKVGRIATQISCSLCRILVVPGVHLPPLVLLEEDLEDRRHQCRRDKITVPRRRQEDLEGHHHPVLTVPHLHRLLVKDPHLLLHTGRRLMRIARDRHRQLLTAPLHRPTVKDPLLLDLLSNTRKGKIVLSHDALAS